MVNFNSGHALLIGVGEYQNSKWNAPITIADTQAVADALTDPNIVRYPIEHVELLNKSQATREGVVAALERLADRTKQNDTLIIFFCGHGALGTDGNYYFATHDAFFVDGLIQSGTGLSSPNLLALLRQIKAQKLLFIINACFSGHMSPTLGSPGILGAPPSALFGAEILASGEGRALITASRPSQYSYYQRGQKYTFFGQALVEGLRGKAVNSGGYIGLYELYQHIYISVKEAAAKVNGSQEPVLTILENIGPFPLALYPGAIPAELSTASIQQTPPTNAVVEVLPQSLVQAIGRESQVFNFQSSGSVEIDQSRKIIDFGISNTFGDMHLGDVAGGNIIRIDIKVTSADAASSNTRQELLDLIAKLPSNVSQQLADAPKGKRGDVVDELRKAKEAGEEGDIERLREKLESAQKILLTLGDSIPIALKLSETIGALLQRVVSVFA